MAQKFWHYCNPVDGGLYQFRLQLLEWRSKHTTRPAVRVEITKHAGFRTPGEMHLGVFRDEVRSALPARAGEVSGSGCECVWGSAVRCSAGWQVIGEQCKIWVGRP